MMILTPDVSHAYNMLAWLNELSWCRMSFNLKKSRNLTIVKGKVVAMAFSVEGYAIPRVMDEPVKSFGRVYENSHTDNNAVQHNGEMT